MTRPLELKPWETHDLRCERCGAPATSWACAPSETIGPGPGVITLGLDSSQIAELVCEDHYDAALNDICDEHGGASGLAITMSWGWWFRQTWVGRPFDLVGVAFHNWRFRRGVDGKRFGLPMDHIWVPFDQPER